MKVMLEKDNGFVQLPPFSTCRLCRNDMNEMCMEECAPAKDYKWFELKRGINLEDMPRFPLQEYSQEMSPKIRQIVIGIYVAKLVDQLQGVRDERTNLYYPRNRRISKALQKQDVPHGPDGHDPAHQDRPQCADPGERPDEVVGEKPDSPNS